VGGFSGFGFANADPSRQPRNAGQHTAPTYQPYDGCDLRVVVENAEASKDGEKVVLHKIRVAGRDQWKLLHSRVGHIRGCVKPILEEEEQTEDKA
jgi:hypothetical protein